MANNLNGSQPVHTQKEVQDALYSLACILWDLIPYEDREKLGKTKADFVINFYNQTFNP